MSCNSDDALPDAPAYVIGSWSMGDDGFDLGVRVNDKHFRIGVWEENFTDSPSSTKTLQQVVDLMNSGNDYCAEVWDYLKWIVDHFLPRFQSLAPPVVHTGKLTLAHLAIREAYECDLSVVGEEPVAGPVALREEDGCFEEFDARTLRVPFPIITLKDVEVPYEDPHRIFEIIPDRVSVHGQPCFYKQSFHHEATRDEIDKYAKIAASGLSFSDLRTPRLHAIVVGYNGGMRGLVYDIIDAESKLTWAVDEHTPVSLREKWAAQIKDTVAKLHHLDIVWGDVKSDNVLVDKEGNAVVIDLEGGTTRDWVDFEKGSTVEGDRQGLERMMDFIFNDKSELRPPPRKPGSEPIDKL